MRTRWLLCVMQTVNNHFGDILKAPVLTAARISALWDLSLCTTDADRYATGFRTAVVCFARCPSPGGLPYFHGGTQRARTDKHVLELGLCIRSLISEHQIKVGVLLHLDSNLTGFLWGLSVDLC